MTSRDEWRPFAERLADQLYGAGYVRQRGLREAFAETPRHIFLPQILSHRYDGSQQVVTTRGADDPGWLETVYRDEPFVTQYKPLATRPGHLMPTSSSTKPSLMADMIEELGIQPGMDVLESGTGTGYNAAILCHLLGDAHVTTTDIDPELVSRAQARLAEVGYRPAVTPRDRTYDRILATHAVEQIPHAWLRWAKPGGQILVDLRSRNMPHVGAWAKLTVDPSGTAAAGHLVPDRGAFMNARKSVQHSEGHEQQLLTGAEDLRDRPGSLTPDVLNLPDFAFALWCQLPNTIWRCYESRGQLHANVTTTDATWADVTADSIDFTAIGDPWAAVEEIWREWNAADRPGLDAYAIRVTPDGRTVIEAASR